MGIAGPSQAPDVRGRTMATRSFSNRQHVIIAVMLSLVVLLGSVGSAFAQEQGNRAPFRPDNGGPADTTPAPGAPENQEVPVPSLAANAFFVSPTGDDANPGTIDRPWRTLVHAIPQLRAGQTLYFRGGEYPGDVILRGSVLSKGTPDARITLTAYPGENPVIRGLVQLSNSEYYTWDNVDVKWPEGRVDPSQHMVRFWAGTGLEVRNSEFSEARSYAALLIYGGMTNFRIANNYIRDTYASNQLSQDHLIYIGSGVNGIVERNLLVNAPNGRGVKIGHPEGGLGLPAGITVRFNTMVNNGSGNTAVSYDAYDNTFYGNIMVGAGENYTNIHNWNLSGGNNRAFANVGWGSTKVLKDGIVDDGGNLYVDPQLDANFVPRNSQLYNAQGQLMYGHLATATQ